MFMLHDNNKSYDNRSAIDCSNNNSSNNYTKGGKRSVTTVKWDTITIAIHWWSSLNLPSLEKVQRIWEVWWRFKIKALMGLIQTFFFVFFWGNLLNLQSKFQTNLNLPYD